MKTFTSAEVVGMIKGVVKEHQTSLMGLMDTVPEALKAGVKKVHDDLNEFLSGLPPMEQSDAAPTASWAIQSLMASLSRFGEMMAGITAQSKRLATEYNSAITELNSFKTQVKDGLLISKELVQSSVEKAKQEGIDSLLPDIVAGRKTAVQLLGLPEAGEAILKLPTADFNSRVEQAKKNLVALDAKGMKLGGKGDAWVKQTAWQNESEFSGSMNTIADLHPAPAAAKAEPMLGNKGEAEKVETRSKFVGLV